MTHNSYELNPPLYAPDRDQQTNRTQQRPAGVQRNHRRTPDGAVVIPEVEVEAVKAVIDPPLHTRPARESRNGLSHMRIDIKPGGVRVTELDTQDRQWRAALTRVVIGVVIRKQVRLDEWHIGISFLNSA